MNFNEQMKEKINSLSGAKKKILLHSCCAPCSSAVIEKLAPHFEITVLYYNPNIMPLDEYEKRKAEQIKFLEKINVKHFETEYSHQDFLTAISGKENLGERSPRCYECYKLRIFKTAEVAKLNGYQIFCTTLSVSPHKNAEWINELMALASQKFGIEYLPSDFKKENGYLRSLELSRENNFYRQNYCGCKF
jgi:predicted adenine nucleotide alpha hydrolase (AANH) superfamily ATPase